MNFDRTIYNSVILGALLHDIGKFLQRIKSVRDKYYKISHPVLGADFVSWKGVFAEENSDIEETWQAFSKSIDKLPVDKQKLDDCIRKHHSGFWQWGHIVHQSDSYSTKERFREDENVQTYPPQGRLVALQPVFSSVFLDKQGPEEKYGYHPTQLDSFKSFPDKNLDKLEDNESEGVFNAFIKELAGVEASGSDFKRYYNTVHSVLEKYLWCMPCHTHRKIADVSIFDHLKSSSAIAACLYKYHYEHDEWAIGKHIKDGSKEKLLLVGGDLSGIQKYIYQISAITGEGGVAKRLRARSFYVSALVEVTINKILEKLDLPISCQFLSTGGKFIILAPNTEKTKKDLQSLNYEISKWLLDEFSGELSLTMDWSIQLKGDDFYRKSDFECIEKCGGEEEIYEEKNPELPRECNFRDRLDELWLEIERKKTQKFSEVLSACGEWNETPFVRTALYNSYGDGAEDCRSCKKFPAEFKDPHNDENEDKVLCRKCCIDKKIGRKLLDAEYLVIGKGGANDAEAEERLDRFDFFNGQYFIEILKSYDSPKWNEDWIVVQKLRDHKDETMPVAFGCTHRFMANYTPFFEKNCDNKSLCEKCREPDECEQKARIEKSENKELYSFSCIAASSSTPIGRENEYKGVQRIGVLKADVDNLGLIFSEGLQNRITPSRYLTMSRMLDLFFSGWMYRILKETPDYKEIYTVYSGGDDLVVVGPWEKVIYFAQKLNQEFRHFTCNNKAITLSAGIAIVHPKYPISSAVELAERSLEASKTNEDKDSITVFNTTVKWDELPDIVNKMHILNKGHNRYEQVFTAQFLHRILGYRKMYLEAKKGDVNKLIFHSYFYYDVRRNLINRIEKDSKSDKKWFRDNILNIMRRLYQTPTDDLLMRSLNISVNCVLYKNRKYKKWR